MNQELALNTLSTIMGWGDEQARQEFDWLKLMARLKYDGYRDFQAGVRFIESLATWLQQFKNEHRPIAYQFVRQALVYIGPTEMQKLVEQFFPHTVRDRIMRLVANAQAIPTYHILSNADALTAIELLRRKTLFLGLSDGARIDAIRHVNSGVLSNEQLVLTAQLDVDKWKDLLKDLRADTGDVGAKFRLAYLIDDFMGTGTSFLRYSDEKNKWVGKLVRFQESLKAAADRMENDFPFENGWELCVHHYIATTKAKKDLAARLKNYQENKSGHCPSQIHLSFGTVLPPEFPIDARGTIFADFIQLTRDYYDPGIQTKHTDVGGVQHLGLGYGGCGLPLILDHNTPNNSVALLWAETDGGVREGGVVASPMRSLFRRRQRHV